MTDDRHTRPTLDFDPEDTVVTDDPFDLTDVAPLEPDLPEEVFRANLADRAYYPRWQGGGVE